MNSRFIDRMILHWTDTLHLPCTNALIEGWAQLENAVGNSTKLQHWQVLPLPTGAGKTEALIVLLATTPINQLSALVVTKFKCEADKIAQAINRIAGSKIAIAAHSDAKSSPCDMATMPVLVITHKAYTNALCEAEDADSPYTLDMYRRYHQSERNWLVIDEAFNWVNAYEVEMDDFASMCGHLSSKLPLDAIEAMKLLIAFERSIHDMTTSDRTDRPLTAEQTAILIQTNFHTLDSAIRKLPTDATEGWRTTELRRRTKDAQRTSFKKQYLDLIQQLRAIQRIGWGWLSCRGNRTRLHSSRTLLNTNRRCGVVLDATANVDTSYDLFGSSIVVLPRPEGIRSYSNVNFHVSRAHRVGKVHLTKSANTDWPVVADGLAEHIAPTSKALVITHKDVRDHVRQCGIKSKAFEVAHWGDLDGKNDWNDFNAVVVYGLPYLDDIFPTNAALASRDLQPTDWFAGRRQHRQHSDMKAALKIGFTSRSVVQAINRAHCRKITDDQGSCCRTDVFILLPSGDRADAVIAAIQREMPGSNIIEWKAASVIGNRLSPSERRLVTLLRECGPAIYTQSQIIALLSITSRTYQRMSARLRKRSSVLMLQLAAIGVDYRHKTRCGKEACFIKH